MIRTSTNLTAGRCHMPWAIVQARNEYFALDTRNLKEMVLLPDVVSIPDTPPHIRGAINLRGTVLPLLDLRTLLGMPSAAQECESLCQMLDQRERDHRNWLDELTSCVREGRPFTLATDPHQCAFGRWYDSFRTNDLMLARQLKKLNAPHIAIHEVAATAIALMSKGDKDGTRTVIEAARQGALRQLLDLLSGLRSLLRETSREVGLVLTDGTRSCSLAVDAVESVERLKKDSILPLGTELMQARSSFVRRIGRRAKGEGLVLILEAEPLLGQAT